MKNLLLSFILSICALSMVAQPPARRKAEAEKSAAQTKTTPVASSIREFPTAPAMPTDVTWRREIFRELDLTEDENAVLYFPTTATTDGRENLFNYVFKLILRRQIKAYKYNLDGNERFDAENVVTAKQLMDANEILYEERDGRFRVNDADLPNEEVKSYFIKEVVYYDRAMAQMRTRVTAICPVLHRADDYSGSIQKRPLFWVNYDEAAPYLGKLMLMGSNYNNASMLSADDFFTLSRYDGDIYKVSNLQDRLIADYCPTDTAVKREQERIEKELTDFQRILWKGDSVNVKVDTLAVVQGDSVVAVEKKTVRRSARRGTTDKVKKEKKKKEPTVKRQSAPSSGGGGLSVRRQRR
ncbi:MAG: gliding motility protein GldN [Bacteroidaceae bacterium]|nr:gliding motility protein GldN [Bacteroidaceae bacterium]